MPTDASSYGSALRATVAASAGPYGYTLTIWTSGAILAHARGIPDAGSALLFAAGAVVAYTLVGGLAFGGFHARVAPASQRAVVWGGLHLFSVGIAIGAAALIARLVGGLAVWPLGGFCATAVYLTVSALQLMVAHTAWSSRGPDDSSSLAIRISASPASSATSQPTSGTTDVDSGAASGSVGGAG